MRTLVFALAFRRKGAAGGWGRRLSTNSDIVRLIADASPLSKAVLLILLSSPRSPGASSSTRSGQFRRAARQTATFLDVFRKSSKFSEVQAVCPTLPESPLVGMFQAGYAELNTQLRAAQPEPAKPAPPPGVLP